MPLYDYRCSDCSKRFTLLLGVVAEPAEERCPHCGSTGIQKLISRFARLRSEDEMIDTLADPSKLGDVDDPAELRSWMKRMGREMGEDVDDDIDEAFDDDSDRDDHIAGEPI